MGRPGANLEKRGSITAVKKKNSSSNLSSKEKKKKKHYFKSKFKTSIGSSKEGHGFAAIQKRKLISRFKKKLKRKKKPDEKDSPTKKVFTINESTLTDSKLSSIIEDSTNDYSTNSGVGSSVLSTADDSAIASDTSATSTKKKRNSKNLKLVEIDYQAIQEERKMKFQELQVNRSQHEEFVSGNIVKRKHLMKKMSKRTRKGQPIMANRLEHLLGQIKAGSGSNRN